MLTMIGLVAAAGLLYLATLVVPISIWAMNFALMFALALGIDYALFVLQRFRAIRSDEPTLPAVEATARTMDGAGSAVLFSGITVLISLTAVVLVPSPAFRSMSLGIGLTVLLVLAAALTLLPAALARLGARVDSLSLPWARRGGHGSARAAAWGRRLWRRPLAYGAAAVALLAALAVPAGGISTQMPSIEVVPQSDTSRVGYRAVQEAFGSGAAGPLQIVAPRAQAAAVASLAARDPGVATVPAPATAGELALVTAVPRHDPADPAVGDTIERLRAGLPAGALVGGAVAETHDLEVALDAATPLVIGIVLLLSFVVLVLALRAPLIAAAAVLTNLLATAAAFGAAKLIFQDGALESLLGFHSQGFLDAWGPVFFFAMVFAISMDYTVFLLASAKERWDATGDPREAVVGGLERSGRVIFAAGAVMVAVFFTFALSGPLPPKEMGIILGIAVLLDAAVVRLLLLPVLLRLMGRWAWYMPRRRGLPAALPIGNNAQSDPLARVTTRRQLTHECD
jgi:RND superfamily putative drug exporter